MGVYFRVYNTPRLFKQSVLMRGVKNRTENILILLNYDFWCKNLDNIISGPRRTVQNRKLRQFMTPLSGGITLGTFYYIFYYIHLYCASPLSTCNWHIAGVHSGPCECIYLVSRCIWLRVGLHSTDPHAISQTVCEWLFPPGPSLILAPHSHSSSSSFPGPKHTHTHRLD